MLFKAWWAFPIKVLKRDCASFVSLFRSKNTIGRLMKTCLYRPIKIFYFLFVEDFENIWHDFKIFFHFQQCTTREVSCASNKRFFFSIWVLFHEHSRIKGLKGMGEGILLTPHYHFRPLHRHLDISRTITAESSPLRIASSRTRTRTFGFRAQVANH